MRAKITYFLISCLLFDIFFSVFIVESYALRPIASQAVSQHDLDEKFSKNFSITIGVALSFIGLSVISIKNLNMNISVAPFRHQVQQVEVELSYVPDLTVTEFEPEKLISSLGTSNYGEKTALEIIRNRKNPKMILALIEALKENYDNIVFCKWAMFALEGMGQYAKSALPLLKKIGEESTVFFVREKAKEAGRKIEEALKKTGNIHKSKQFQTQIFLSA